MWLRSTLLRALELEDCKVFTGILLRSSSVDVYRDATGKERVFQKSDVVARRELKTSLMPYWFGSIR